MRLKTLALTTTVLSALMVAGYAEAQTKTAPADSDTVVVTGFRKSLANALDTKKRDIRVSDSISSEDLGKFPSENIAEAIQRIPGVQMADVNGRGATISIRGLGPQYALTTVNGQDFKSADFTDGFRYDIIQTELAAGIQVYKSPTADMDAGGLAGTVNIETVHPLDRKGRQIVLTAKAQQSQLANGNATPKVGVSYVDHFDDGKLGVFLGYSYQELTDRADYLWMDRWYSSTGSASDGFANVIPAGYVPRRLRYRRIDRQTLRQQVNAAVQYKPIDGLELGLTGIYSKDNTRYDVNQQVFLFSKSGIAGVSGDGSTELVTTQSNYTLENNRQQETRNLATTAWTGTAKWTGTENWTLKGTAHYSKGRAHLTEEAAILGVSIASSTLDISNPDDIKFTVSNDLSSATPYAATSLTRNEFPDGAQHADYSEEGAGQFDAKRDLDFGVLSSVSFGAKYKREVFYRYTTRRDLGGNIAAVYTPDIASDGYLVSDFLNGDDSVQHAWIAPNMKAYEAALAAAGITVPTVWAPEDSYKVTRNVTALYAMANLKGEILGKPYRGDVGVRYEDTGQVVNANITSGSNPLNENVGNPIGTQRTPMDYSNILPSANFVVDLDHDLLLRVAAAKVLVRPILDANNPLVTTVSTSTLTGGGQQFTIQLGQATLKPLTADQLDVGLEWYYGTGNGLSVAGFLKNVKNGTYATTVCPSSFNGTALSGTASNCTDASGNEYQITSVANDPTIVKIKGFEVNWQQSFDMWLPVKGFGVISNYTYVTPSKNGTSGFHLANLSQNTVNVTGYWENKVFSARLSANYRSAYSQTSAESFFAREGHTIEGRTQYDLTLGYNVNDRMSLSFGAINITNAEEKAYKDIKTRWQMTSVVGSSYYLSLQYKM